MFSILGKLVGFINQSIAVIGITGGVALSFVNVVARYVFDASLTWATELSIFLFIWSAFFAAAYCFKKDAHIGIDIILELVPTSVAKIMLLLAHLVSFVFLVAIAYFGYEYLELVIDLEEMSIDLAIPMWIPYLVIPIAFSFAAYRVAEKIVHIIKTPHTEVLKESEAEMIMASMGIANSDEKFKKTPKELDEMVKQTHKKTGGML
jgi:C4-dicarboxylate transporter DctQ subunit